MSPIRIHGYCTGLSTYPLLVYGINLIVVLDWLALLVFIRTPQVEAYKRDKTNPKVKLPTCGWHFPSISRTWTEPMAAVFVASDVIAMQTLYSICLVDWWDIFSMTCVHVLILCVVYFNGWGVRGKYHPIPATLVFTLITGLVCAANSVYVGWYVGNATSSAQSTISLLLCLDYAVLIGLAIGVYLDQNREWPPWLALIEHIFLLLTGVYCILMYGATLVWP
jgi:hypothetical protein